MGGKITRVFFLTPNYDAASLNLSRIYSYTRDTNLYLSLHIHRACALNRLCYFYNLAIFNAIFSVVTRMDFKA